MTTTQPVMEDQFLRNATADGPLPFEGPPDFPVPRFARGYAIWPAVAPNLVGGRRLKATKIIIVPSDLTGPTTEGIPQAVRRNGNVWELAGIANTPEITQQIMATAQLKGWRVGLTQLGKLFGIYRR